MRTHRILAMLAVVIVTFAGCSGAAPQKTPAPLPDAPSEGRNGALEATNPFRQTAPGGAGSSRDLSQVSPPLQRAAQGAEPSAPSSSPAQGRQEGDSAAPQGTRVDDSATQLPIIAGLGRMIVYTTDLALVIENLDAFPNQLGTIAVAHGGYVAGVETKEENGVPTVTVRLKVAPSQYEAAMQMVRGLAVEVREEKAGTRDVTEEHDDVATHIASLEATHAQLLRIQERSGTIEEVLQVQQQAAQVKTQIDRLKGRLVAMERLSELATITAKGYLASAMLPRDYATVRAGLRRAEVNRANLEAQLRRVRTPEEEAGFRDRLAEVILEQTRLHGRAVDVESKAGALRITLPTGDSVSPVARIEETLPKEYVQARIELRRARQQYAEATRLLREGHSSLTAEQFTELAVRVNQLEGQLRSVEERARQSGIVLPTLTPEDEALLAGVPTSSPGRLEMPAMIRIAWEASLAVLVALVSGLVFSWWIVLLLAVFVFLIRRRQTTPTESRSAPAAEA